MKTRLLIDIRMLVKSCIIFRSDSAIVASDRRDLVVDGALNFRVMDYSFSAALVSFVKKGVYLRGNMIMWDIFFIFPMYAVLGFGESIMSIFFI
jgi:hypothetical protein